MSGETDVEIDMVQQKAVKNKLLIIFPGQIVSLQKVSPDFSFLYIKLSSKFMSEILFRFPPAFVGYIKENNTHEYGELEFDKFYRHCFCSLKLYYGDEENLFRREIIMNTLRNFFLDVYDKIKRHESLEHSSRSRKTEIMERFCSLVLKHFKTIREVSFYADKLHITPKYLSAILKELDMDKRSAKE
ncbi:MAG: hypothetical protein LBP67_05365 [Bacteroidales bacterium]|jgi:hypothetical protein|nr:hypothetical protein [Bacteroidales bacterium]